MKVEKLEKMEKATPKTRVTIFDETQRKHNQCQKNATTVAKKTTRTNERRLHPHSQLA